MDGTPLIPTRITIDFSQAIHPARGWIIGRSAEGTGRVELLAFDAPAEIAPSGALPAAALDDCTCPEYCERDHANE